VCVCVRVCERARGHVNKAATRCSCRGATGVQCKPYLAISSAKPRSIRNTRSFFAGKSEWEQVTWLLYTLENPRLKILSRIPRLCDSVTNNFTWIRIGYRIYSLRRLYSCTHYNYSEHYSTRSFLDPTDGTVLRRRLTSRAEHF
jgi:hypothetical protein